MNEELFDIRARVTKKVNVLIEKLKEHQNGPVGAEEYGRDIWDREALRSICTMVFEETVKEINSREKK
jgi:hypothetical protein